MLTLSHCDVLAVAVTVFCGDEGQVEVDRRTSAGSVQVRGVWGEGWGVAYQPVCPGHVCIHVTQ